MVVIVGEDGREKVPTFQPIIEFGYRIVIAI
jgi:hypothetical protein